MHEQEPWVAVVVGGINLGGSIEPVYNAVSIVELAVEKGATASSMPWSVDASSTTSRTTWRPRST